MESTVGCKHFCDENHSKIIDITVVHHCPYTNVTHLYQHVAQLLEMSPLCDLLAQKVLCVCAESVWPIQTEGNSAGRLIFIIPNFQTTLIST